MMETDIILYARFVLMQWTDMFNGYVWQTRTLEVRPDRLPNDFDMGMASNNLPPLTKMASPQLMQFSTSMNMPNIQPTSSIHPLSMSTSSNSSLQPTMMAPSLSMTATSTLPQSLGAPQMDSSLSAYSTETVPNGANGLNGLDGADITRSTSAFKASSTMPSSTAAPSGVSSDVLGYSQMGAASSSFGAHAVNDYSSNRGSSASGRSDSPDYQGKKIYVSNVSVDCDSFLAKTPDANSNSKSDFNLIRFLYNTPHKICNICSKQLVI